MERSTNFPNTLKSSPTVCNHSCFHFPIVSDSSSTKILFQLSKNIITITFHANGWTSTFFCYGAEICPHSINLLFVSMVKWWIHISSTVGIRCSNSFPSTEYRAIKQFSPYKPNCCTQLQFRMNTQLMRCWTQPSLHTQHGEKSHQTSYWTSHQLISVSLHWSRPRHAALLSRRVSVTRFWTCLRTISISTFETHFCQKWCSISKIWSNTIRISTNGGYILHVKIY